MGAVTSRESYDVEPDGVVIRAVAITACYAAAAWLLRRLGLRRARLPELGWFAAVGVVGAPPGAAVVVAVTEILVLDATGAAAFDPARPFWIGDAVAIATIVPTLPLLATPPRARGRAPPRPAPPAPPSPAAP